MKDTDDKAFGLVKVEWDNSGKLVALELAIGMIALLLLGFLNAVFVNTGELGLASTVTFLQFLIVFSALVFVGEKAFESLKDKDVFETVGYGKSITRFLLAIGLGAVFAFFLNLGNLSIVVIGLQSFITTNAMNLLFVVFFAATVEELFFRGSLLPTLNKVFKVGGLPFHAETALVLQALLFGLFHFGVILAVNPSASFFDPRIIMSVIFGLSVGIGNGLLESTGFSYAAHLTNNFLALMAMGGF